MTFATMQNVLYFFIVALPRAALAAALKPIPVILFVIGLSADTIEISNWWNSVESNEELNDATGLCVRLKYSATQIQAEDFQIVE